MSYISASAARFWLRVVCSHCRSGMDYLLGVCLDMVLEVRDRRMGNPDAAFYGVQKIVKQVVLLHHCR